MLDFSLANPRFTAVAWVGNKARYEGMQVPQNPLLSLHTVAEELLIHAFLKPFEKTEEFFSFHHEEDISNHPVYQCCMSVFEDPEKNLPAEMNKLATRLYQHCELPKINAGEFFAVYFEDLQLNGEGTNALALVKIQTKDPFLKLDRTDQAYAIQVIEGIPTGKLETAALIYQLDESEGYRVCAIDTVSKKDERSFWKDDFLRLRPIEDNYFNTRHYIGLSGEFITHKLPHAFGLDRTDQIDALTRAGFYFKENEDFELEDYTKALFPDAEQEPQRKAFKEFKQEYAKAYAVPLEDKFEISGQAVKKEFKVLKSVIKLDKNFHIYVHGRRDLIERGFDEDKGKKYYKVYFDDEE